MFINIYPLHVTMAIEVDNTDVLDITHYNKPIKQKT